MPPTHPAQQQDQTALAPAFHFLNKYHPVSNEVIQYIGSKLKLIQLKKGDVLHQSGTICEHIYFVMKGILRGYIIDNKKEVTTWITSENEIVSSIRSYLLRQPTAENMVAIEDCHLLAMHHSDLEYVYDNFPEFNTNGRKIAEYYYAFAEDRAFLCRLSKAEDRYNHFMIGNSHLINRIPLTYIASYLNMTLETLSRIRSKLAQKRSSSI